MKGYSKQDVQFHRDGYGPSRPAINVKVRNLNWPIAEELGVSEEIAEQAGELALESAQVNFWNEAAPDLASECLGDVQVFSEGRQSGWLVVHGLDDFETWDAVQLAKWRKFEVGIRDLIRDLTDWQTVKENIEANRWAEPGARLYNWYEFEDGHSEAFPDMVETGKACPHCGKVLVH
jgi:hypothetical protein